MIELTKKEVDCLLAIMLELGLQAQTEEINEWVDTFQHAAKILTNAKERSK